MSDSTEGRGQVVKQKALPFSLYDQHGQPFNLVAESKKSHLLLAFYPGGKVKPVCTSQFCDYRDNFDKFDKYNIRIVGISSDSREALKDFADSQNYPFTFLSDPGSVVADSYGCRSFYNLGFVSRAIVIIHQSGMVLYRYVEPTAFTRRGSDELVAILDDFNRLGLFDEDL